MRAAVAALLLSLAACGGGPGFHRPDYAAEASSLCDEAEGTRDPHRALSLYGLALEADPKMARAFLGRARIFERMSRPTDAERAYSMAVEVAADDARAPYLFERAKYFRQRGRIEPAVRDLDQAVSLLSAWPRRPLEAETRLLRAECRVALRHWAGAREDLEAVMALDPDPALRERARSMLVRVKAEETR